MVGQEQLPKLQNVIKKIYEKFAKIISNFYSMDAEDKTKRYMFIEYSNPASAQEAIKSTNGYILDNGHIFTVNLFSDYDGYEIIIVVNIPVV